MRDTTGPIQRARLHDQVVRQLALRLIQAARQNGEVTLPNEIELTRQLDVSRTVVREAIKVLASKGLVEVRPKTGMRIRPRSDWNLLDPDLLAWQYEAGPDEGFFRDLTEVRLIVETATSELAARRATTAELDELDYWYGQMEATVTNTEAFIAADMQFHTAIVKAAHNELLRQMSATLGNALRESRLITTQIPGSSVASLPYHRAVADAIRARDPRAARAAMEHLLVEAAKDVDHVLHGRQREATAPALAQPAIR